MDSSKYSGANSAVGDYAVLQDFLKQAEVKIFDELRSVGQIAHVVARKWRRPIPEKLGWIKHLSQLKISGQIGDALRVSTSEKEWVVGEEYLSGNVRVVASLVRKDMLQEMQVQFFAADRDVRRKEAKIEAAHLAITEKVADEIDRVKKQAEIDKKAAKDKIDAQYDQNKETALLLERKLTNIALRTAKHSKK